MSMNSLIKKTLLTLYPIRRYASPCKRIRPQPQKTITWNGGYTRRSKFKEISYMEGLFQKKEEE